MAEVKFYKVNALPIVCQPDAWYLVGHSNFIDGYVTDSAGVPKKLIDIDFVNQLIANYNASQQNSIIYKCGENINSHTPVVLINNMLYKMNNTNMLHQFSFVGFTKTSGIAGSDIEVIDKIINLTGWGLVPGMHYLSGINGTVVTNVTSGNSFKKIIGFAQDADTLLIYKNYDSIINI
jgi:hypothetical protein